MYVYTYIYMQHTYIVCVYMYVYGNRYIHICLYIMYGPTYLFPFFLRGGGQHMEAYLYFYCVVGIER